MADKHTQEQADNSNMQKNPDDWTSGDEPMTRAHRSYLKTLSEEANEHFDENLTKAQASKAYRRITAEDRTRRWREQPNRFG